MYGEVEAWYFVHNFLHENGIMLETISAQNFAMDFFHDEIS